MSPSILVAALAAVVTSLATPAHAWESECRPGDQRFSVDIDESICGVTLPGCAEGVDAARGTLYGEHTWITVEALKLAGLSPLVDLRAFPTFYTDLSAPPVGGKLVQTPGLPGAMLDKVTLPVTLAELSQVPDVSYGLADFIAGNEHCFAEHAPRSSFEDIQACHTYFTHLGPVNSTHFLPQARAMYARHHALALEVAKRCRQLRDVVGTTHPLHGWIKDVALPACELEALAFEATASHYLEDAWSSGHMWQRWGAPNLGTDGRFRYTDIALGALSGIVHGWRAVAANTLKLSNPLHHYDRLCLGGPLPTVDDERVEWTYPGTNAFFLGGGDDFLLACKVPDQDETWAFATSPHLEMARNMMLSCTARGFLEVYNAGPQTRGTFAAPTDPRLMDDSDPNTDACWAQRATNRSMYLAQGISSFPSTRNPLFAVSLALLVEGIPIPNISLLSLKLRADLAASHFKNFWRAKVAPLETDLADLEGFGIETMLGASKNSAYLGLIETGDQVPYLERKEMSDWFANRQTRTCTVDGDCAPSEYCAAGVLVGETMQRCVGKEVAITSAWRAGNVAAFCADDDKATIQTAVADCGKSGKRSSDACAACAEVVLPHLRNACDEGSYEPSAPSVVDETTPIDHRSLCDLHFSLGDPLPVYWPYDPAVASAPAEAARDACCRPDANGVCQSANAAGLEPSYHPERAFPTTTRATWDDIPGVQPLVVGSNLCGGGGLKTRDHGIAMDHTMTEYYPHLHRFTLTTSALVTPGGVTHLSLPERLRLRLYDHDCTTLIAEAPAPTTAGGPLELLWKPEWEDEFVDFCVRVSPLDTAVWTAYQLKVTYVEPVDAGFEPGCSLGAECQNCGDDFLCDETVPAGCSTASDTPGGYCCPSLGKYCCNGDLICLEGDPCGTTFDCVRTGAGDATHPDGEWSAFFRSVCLPASPVGFCGACQPVYSCGCTCRDHNSQLVGAHECCADDGSCHNVPSCPP